MPILEGALSVQAALDARSRAIVRIDLARGCDRPSALRAVDQARRRGIPVRVVERAELDRHASGTTHGGIVALVGERRFVPAQQLIEGTRTPFLALLDGLEDPYGFGHAVRSLYAAGAHGLFVRRATWAHAETVVARASAGASERLPTALLAEDDELAEAVAAARERGVRIVCAHRSGSVASGEADLAGPLLLAIGGERRGLSRSLLEAADLVVAVRYNRRFRPALDTASATAVLAFEVARQRIRSPSSPGRAP